MPADELGRIFVDAVIDQGIGNGAVGSSSRATVWCSRRRSPKGSCSPIV